MGDRHDSTGKALEKHFQPLDRLGVQVVGGFVEQQHIGLGQQQAAQRHAALFATGQQADLGVPRRQAQRVGGDLKLVLGVGAGRCNDGFELGLLGSQRVKVGVFGAVGDVDLFQACLGGKDRTHRFLDRFAHRVLGVELGFLLQVANGQPWHGQRFAFELLVHAGHDLEQGGLAGAIEAQHANFGAWEK